MVLTTQENIVHETKHQQIGIFKVAIRDGDRVNINYPCGYSAPAVFVLTGHGVQHAVWTIQDDFEKHVFKKGKIKCEKCADMIGKHTVESPLDARQIFAIIAARLFKDIAAQFKEASGR